MMKKPKLILDLGNTLWKIALFEGKEITELHIVDSNKPGEALSRIRSLGGFSACLLSSVVELPNPMLQFLRKEGHFYELTESTPLPIKNLYHTPATLGKDRLAAAVGASALFPGKDVLLVIAGTCITYEMITARKEYLGGAIAPGIRMRLQALHTFTGKLPLIPFHEKDIMIGRDTEGSILSGVLNACVFESEGFISSYRQRFPNLKVVVSGGDAPYFEKRLKSSIFAAPNIVLKGLNEILDHNA
jgi:type III pantothenate kinase